MKRAAGLIAILLIASPAFALKLGGGDLKFAAEWGILYDSNLLKYSPRDRDRYQNKSEASPSSIRSLDDIRTDYNLSAEFRKRYWGKRSTTLRAAVKFAHHINNPIKNLGWISLSGRQEFSKQWIASAGWFFEPEFYIRNFSDPHTGGYQRCEFALNQWRGDVTFRPWGMIADLLAGIKLKQYRYNKYFTEYDGDLIETGASVVLRPEGWRVSAEYTFGTFDNSGYNSSDLLMPGSFLDDTEFGEGDYKEDGYRLTARREFAVYRRDADVELFLDLSNRAYTTNRDLFIDPMHSAREDRILSFGGKATIGVTERIGLSIEAASFDRNSSAPSPLVAPVKDYTRWTAGAGVSWQFE